MKTQETRENIDSLIVRAAYKFSRIVALAEDDKGLDAQAVETAKHDLACLSKYLRAVIEKSIGLVLACMVLAGCETVTHEDGSTSTRFDAKTAASALDAGFGAYDRYRAYNQPTVYPASPQPYAAPQYYPRY